MNQNFLEFNLLYFMINRMKYNENLDKFYNDPNIIKIRIINKIR